MPYVDNRGVRIGYRVHGQGEPLVLVHGWSCEGRYWDEFGYVSKLGTEFKVIVPDLRGHGESDTPKDRDFSDQAFASDVIVVLDHLGIDSAHIFGYSLGGWVVFELAANFSSRVRRAIACGAHPYDEDLSALRGFAPADILKAWEAVNAPLSKESKKRIAALDQQVLIEIAVDRVGQAARLKGLQIPWLLICGTNDWRFEEMKRFAGNQDRSEFVPLEGLDHLQTWIRSELVLPSVQGFLRLRA
ncbi:MAG TPA: alpha/beta hydrolase [Candidatus Binatia bacterium]|nr:alpha/beta hydrolase [Candidatus Binatia bacterium]